VDLWSGCLGFIAGVASPVSVKYIMSPSIHQLVTLTDYRASLIFILGKGKVLSSCHNYFKTLRRYRKINVYMYDHMNSLYTN